MVCYLFNMRYYEKGLYAIGFTSLIFPVLMILYYVYASFQIGWMPTYGNPDPSTLESSGSFGSMIFFFAIIWFFLLFVWILIAAIYYYEAKRKIAWKPIIFSSVVHLICFCVFNSEMVNWLID